MLCHRRLFLRQKQVIVEHVEVNHGERYMQMTTFLFQCCGNSSWFHPVIPFAFLRFCIDMLSCLGQSSECSIVGVWHEGPDDNKQMAH